MEKKATLLGCDRGRAPGRVAIPTLLMTALLSTTHRNLQRWKSPQKREIATTSKNGAAKPPISLLVDVPITSVP